MTSAFVSRAGWLAYGVAAAVVAVDQITKQWALKTLLLPGVSVDVLGPLSLTLVWNRGASFGLLRTDLDWSRWVLTAFALVVAVSLGVFVRRVDKPMTGVSIGLIMAGALGNVIDRIRLGAVVDFIDVQRLHFPWVFNAADASINVGVALFVLEGVLSSRRKPA